MPFIKPQANSFNIVIVGDKATTILFKIIQKYMTGKLQNTHENLLLTTASPKDSCCYFYSKKGFKAKVNIWRSVSEHNHRFFLPNVFRGSHITLLVCDWSEFLSKKHPKQFTYSKEWTDILNHEDTKAERILVIHAKENTADPRILQNLANHYKCTEHCMISDANDVGKLLQIVHRTLFKYESALYHNIETELKRIDLKMDKSSIVNTTSCYERNGIA